MVTRTVEERVAKLPGVLEMAAFGVFEAAGGVVGTDVWTEDEELAEATTEEEVEVDGVTPATAGVEVVAACVEVGAL